LIDKELIVKVSDLLRQKNFTISTAESCTGGLIAHSLTNVSGSSKYFDRGIVSYSNRAKTELLEIPKGLIIKYGAVSEQVAKAMAEGVRKLSKVDIGLSSTGIAGPTGGTDEKPVGLVYIGCSTIRKNIVKEFRFCNDRTENKEKTCNAALQLLFDVVNSSELW
jgi:nicotinamide-nucleotide amidase